MKLRKLLATTAMAFLMGASANAQNPTVEDVRIYINPGHGSWPSARPARWTAAAGGEPAPDSPYPRRSHP